VVAVDGILLLRKQHVSWRTILGTRLPWRRSSAVPAE
jgi:hypothetical protein